MAQLFGNATVCENGRPPPCTLRLDPDINHIMSTSRDFGTLYYLWNAWRSAVGPPMRRMYTDFIKLSNEGAVLNGYEDTGDMWRSAYEMSDLESTLEDLFTKLLPFYQQLHVYVRRRLSSMYPGYLYKDGPMPAHLLGNMWANSWVSLYEYTTPYPGKWNANPTAAMQAQNYTVERMFHEAEKFYKSLGFDQLPPNFWERSMFVQPKNRAVVCLPAAVDFRTGDDFRVKLCSGVSIEDFVQAHHQVGHIYYYTAYAHQPLAFRDGANPAFHDAVGSTISMSVQTQQHLHRLGLLPKISDDSEADINFLYRTALERISFLPFGYLVDKWRWDVFAGRLNDSNLNSGWWDARERYQGVSPPVPRSEDDFDPGATFHVSQHIPYIKYFISYILQFQFLKALCQAAGHQGPLMKCDIAGSHLAGDKLRSMMSLGSSQPWPEALKRITGGEKLDVEPMLEYFEQLIDWLKRQNEEAGAYIGWDGEGILFPRADEQETTRKQNKPGNVAGNVADKMTTTVKTIVKEYNGVSKLQKGLSLLLLSAIGVTMLV